jgi:DNA-binding transcriptional LysR family regulator
MDKGIAFSLDQLRTFLAVAEEGSFSAAARKLGRTQSVVSYAVATLEEQLGVTLFDRSAWKPRLTGEGRAVLDQARSLVEQAAGLQARAGHLAGGLEPELSIVVDVMYPLPALITALKAFREEFTATALCLRIEALGAVPQAVLDRTAALGVIGSLPTLPAGLERSRIGTVQMVPVAGASHPLAAAPAPIPTPELGPHQQIVLSDRSELSRGRQFGVLSDTRWRVADLAAKHSLLRAGLGWGYMPLPMVEQDLAAGELVRLSLEHRVPRDGHLPLYAVHRTSEPPGPAGSWLIERLRIASNPMEE